MFILASQESQGFVTISFPEEARVDNPYP